MNITQTQILTRLRTWTLVAGLTALVIALGALIGGTFTWIFAAIAVAMNVIGYFLSDRIALRAVRARPLDEAQAPAVHATVRELATRARIPMPRLYLMPGEPANAFATGRNPEHAAIAMTEGLLVNLPLEQIRGVLAHELSHIRNRDILISSLAATIAGAISAIVNVLQLSFLFGGGEEEDSPLGLLGAFATMLLAPLGAMLLQLGVSRQREYLADAYAAELLGTGAPLADALEEIARDRTPLQVNPVSAPMYIVNPLAGGGVGSLFSTHPPVAERIRRLRSYDRAARSSVTAMDGYGTHERGLRERSAIRV
jgi:heat shock protein HtpX